MIIIGKKLNSLYEIKPAINCFICDKAEKINLSVPNFSNSSHAELTTENLDIFHHAKSYGNIEKLFSINIHNNQINIYNYKYYNYIPNNFNIYADYCLNLDFQELNYGPLHSHIRIQYNCIINLKLKKLESIEISLFKLKKNNISIISNSNETYIKYEKTEGSPYGINYVNLGKLPKIEQCVKLIKSNKYSNLL